MATGVEHLVTESLLRQSRQPFIRHHRVFSPLSLPEKFGNDGTSPLHPPILQDVRRVIDILQMQIGLVRQFRKGIPVITLVGLPVRIDLPQHPLRSHLEETGASPGLSCSVTRDLRLETVAQFVCHTVQLFILNTVGCHPQSSNLLVIIPAVGCSLKRIVNHDHHPVTVALRPRLGELQGIPEERIKLFQLIRQVVQIHMHVVSFQLRRIRQVIAESLLPKHRHIIRAAHPLITPFGIRVMEVHAL